MKRENRRNRVLTRLSTIPGEPPIGIESKYFIDE
jgi:hypothetical protein